MTSTRGLAAPPSPSGRRLRCETTRQHHSSISQTQPSTPTNGRWGHFKPSRRGQRKPSFSDILDQKGVGAYMRSFYRALGPTYRRRATIVGIHNYSDVNRKRYTGTRAIIHEAHHYNRHSKLWFTETGGIVKFGKSFPCSSNRAKYRIRYMFERARRYKSYVQRMYAYSWSGNDCRERFDAGLVSRAGTPRTGYYEFKRGLRHFRT